MGRPLNKRLFGATASNNIKVQFNNGTESVRGYIVKQLSARRFLCKDENGNTARCRMVDKASADLQVGEMSITFKFDDTTVQQATKISAHRIGISVGGSNTNSQWNFSTSTTDGYWQIEEAGTNAAMASATDLELDDVPAGLFDKPAPGSGTYLASISPNTTVVGTPYAPGSNVATVTTATLGLWRKKFLGNFGGSPGDGCDVTFVRTTQGFFGKPDTYVSFGSQNDPTEENYTFEWVGYFKAPSSGNFNFYINSDDDVFFWIGTNALGTANTELNAHMGVTGGSSTKNTNSVTLVADQYYPVRIQFGEYTGAENCQLFYAKVGDATAVSGNDGTTGTQVWYHNGTTKGH
jgi:hypothetical protein